MEKGTYLNRYSNILFCLAGLSTLLWTGVLHPLCFIRWRYHPSWPPWLSGLPPGWGGRCPVLGHALRPQWTWPIGGPLSRTASDETDFGWRRMPLWRPCPRVASIHQDTNSQGYRRCPGHWHWSLEFQLPPSRCSSVFHSTGHAVSHVTSPSSSSIAYQTRTFLVPEACPNLRCRFQDSTCRSSCCCSSSCWYFRSQVPICQSPPSHESLFHQRIHSHQEVLHSSLRWNSGSWLSGLECDPKSSEGGHCLGQEDQEGCQRLVFGLQG